MRAFGARPSGRVTPVLRAGLRFLVAPPPNPRRSVALRRHHSHRRVKGRAAALPAGTFDTPLSALALHR